MDRRYEIENDTGVWVREVDKITYALACSSLCLGVHIGVVLLDERGIEQQKPLSRGMYDIISRGNANFG